MDVVLLVMMNMDYNVTHIEIKQLYILLIKIYVVCLEEDILTHI